jgi:outer membrane protein assembly factor BamB
MGHVFVGDVFGSVSALNVKDGTPVWSKSVKLPFAITLGLAVSKDEKALYVGGALGVYALSTSTGSNLWVHSMGSAVTGAVAVDTNGNIYACADGGKIAVRGVHG